VGGRAEPVRFTRWMQRHVRASWPAFGRRRLRLQVCLFLAAADFRRLLRRRPAIAQRWLTSCAIRLAHSHTRILELLEGSLLPRVARLLLDEAVEGHVLLPQRTLAAMLGVHRQSFNKTLKDLQAQRAIAVAYADIRILDPAALTGSFQNRVPRRQPDDPLPCLEVTTMLLPIPRAP
jgi:hypothetical protein